ncbi:MAG TPA: RdgB/HAM1 family non-canonical purine NTP pyrophosphatase [Candidatus Monoglobus merdigallinarum]|uniref:dITP/XTP pyrophosphatase n=1 Tax=Candidatus Monoglobus merdigallinarum TaxID=2838698 RepID=A0A9D1TLD8_9FIRM|nr:RdgB/HAM1 family non-canonical purine NTP pyrophosphatase [Candidatus Monoglobus merdigallinarum]
MKKYVLASQNKHKAEEIKQILGSDYEIITIGEAGIKNIEIIEDGLTFEENAVKKAAAVYERCKLPTIADDSGLCVDYLDGAPGVYTARYAGENASDSENIKKLLRALSGAAPEQRGAKFVCVIACIEDGGAPRLYRGECPGFIAESESGRSGFGYDPVFFLPEYNKTLAELPPEQKNRLSHRYRALCEFKKAKSV